MPKSGNSLDIDAIEGKQGNAVIYSAFMTAEDLWNTVYTLPKSKDSKEELERKLIASKAEAIKEYVEEPNSLLPNSIVINIDHPEKVKVEPINGRFVKIRFLNIDESPGAVNPGEKKGKHG